MPTSLRKIREDFEKLGDESLYLLSAIMDEKPDDVLNTVIMREIRKALTDDECPALSFLDDATFLKAVKLKIQQSLFDDFLRSEHHRNVTLSPPQTSMQSEVDDVIVALSPWVDMLKKHYILQTLQNFRLISDKDIQAEYLRSLKIERRVGQLQDALNTDCQARFPALSSRGSEELVTVQYRATTVVGHEGKYLVEVNQADECLLNVGFFMHELLCQVGVVSESTPYRGELLFELNLSEFENLQAYMTDLKCQTLRADKLFDAITDLKVTWQCLPQGYIQDRSHELSRRTCIDERLSDEEGLGAYLPQCVYLSSTQSASDQDRYDELHHLLNFLADGKCLRNYDESGKGFLFKLSELLSPKTIAQFSTVGRLAKLTRDNTRGPITLDSINEEAIRYLADLTTLPSSSSEVNVEGQASVSRAEASDAENLSDGSIEVDAMDTLGGVSPHQFESMTRSMQALSGFSTSATSTFGELQEKLYRSFCDSLSGIHMLLDPGRLDASDHAHDQLSHDDAASHNVFKSDGEVVVAVDDLPTTLAAEEKDSEPSPTQSSGDNSQSIQEHSEPKEEEKEEVEAKEEKEEVEAKEEKEEVEAKEEKEEVEAKEEKEEVEAKEEKEEVEAKEEKEEVEAKEEKETSDEQIEEERKRQAVFSKIVGSANQLITHLHSLNATGDLDNEHHRVLNVEQFKSLAEDPINALVKRLTMDDRLFSANYFLDVPHIDGCRSLFEDLVAKMCDSTTSVRSVCYAIHGLHSLTQRSDDAGSDPELTSAIDGCAAGLRSRLYSLYEILSQKKGVVVDLIEQVLHDVVSTTVRKNIFKWLKGFTESSMSYELMMQPQLEPFGYGLPADKLKKRRQFGYDHKEILNELGESLSPGDVLMCVFDLACHNLHAEAGSANKKGNHANVDNYLVNLFDDLDMIGGSHDDLGKLQYLYKHYRSEVGSDEVWNFVEIECAIFIGIYRKLREYGYFVSSDVAAKIDPLESFISQTTKEAVSKLEKPKESSKDGLGQEGEIGGNMGAFLGGAMSNSLTQQQTAETREQLAELRRQQDDLRAALAQANQIIGVRNGGSPSGSVASRIEGLQMARNVRLIPRRRSSLCASLFGCFGGRSRQHDEGATEQSDQDLPVGRGIIDERLPLGDDLSSRNGRAIREVTSPEVSASTHGEQGPAEEPASLDGGPSGSSGFQAGGL